MITTQKKFEKIKKDLEKKLIDIARHKQILFEALGSKTDNNLAADAKYHKRRLKEETGTNSIILSLLGLTSYNRHKIKEINYFVARQYEMC